MSIVIGAIGLRQHYDADAITPERIYLSGDAAKFLGIERIDVLRLITSGALRASKGGNGNYLIVGQSLINYLVSPGSL